MKKKVSKRSLQIKYNLADKASKEDFKKRTGKKIARGWKSSPEGKKSARNRRQAFFRFFKKRDNANIQKAIDEGNVQNIRFIDSKPFFVADTNVTGTGTGHGQGIGHEVSGVRAAWDLLDATSDFEPVVYVDTSKIDGVVESYRTRNSFSQKMLNVYREVTNWQDEQDIKVYPVINVSTGEIVAVIGREDEERTIDVILVEIAP